MAWKIIGLILFSLSSLVACEGALEAVAEGSQGEKEASVRSNVAAAPMAEAVSPQPSAQEAEGGRLVFLFSDPPTFDPHVGADAASALVIVELFGGLVTVDQKLEVVPTLPKAGRSAQMVRYTPSKFGRMPSFTTEDR